MLLLVAVAVIGLASAARADSCAALRSQLRASGGGTATSESAQLTRQIAAIRGAERQRQCSSNRSGGLFDACGELARRRADAERQLAKAKFGKGGADIRARLASLGCEAAPQRQARQARQARRGDGYRSYSGAAMLFCVRLGDGYYFPAPNSQFVGDDSYDNTLDRCRYICDDPAMDVYRLNGGDLETEAMVSVKDRRPYKDLAGAFSYREAAAFKSCDLARYSRRVDEARARTITPSNMADVVIPLPTPKPELEARSEIVSDTVASAPVSAYAEDEPARRVRIVGPTFLPEE